MHAQVYHPGNLTRVLCCTDDAAKAEGDRLSLLPSWVAPDFTSHPHLADTYLAYNKPEAGACVLLSMLLGVLLSTPSFKCASDYSKTPLP